MIEHRLLISVEHLYVQSKDQDSGVYQWCPIYLGERKDSQQQQGDLLWLYYYITGISDCVTDRLGVCPIVHYELWSELESMPTAIGKIGIYKQERK